MLIKDKPVPIFTDMANLPRVTALAADIFARAIDRKLKRLRGAESLFVPVIEATAESAFSAAMLFYGRAENIREILEQTPDEIEA